MSMEFENRSRHSGMGMAWVSLIVCFVAAMFLAIWVDITITRLFAAVVYFLIIGPVAIALAALVMKVLASAIFGWKIPYSWLLVAAGFAFLVLQVLGQANYMVYSFVWRFTRLVHMGASLVNILIFSAVVGAVLKVVSGRPWRESFLVTFIGVLGMSILVYMVTRIFGLRVPGFWPMIGV